MRRLTSFALFTALTVTASGCSTMTVRADHDSQVDFATYTTFALFERPDRHKRTPQMSELVDRRITESLAAELYGRGFESASPGQADVLVTYYTAVRKRVVVNGSGWYGYRRRYWGGGFTHVSSYPEGTLVIDVIDRRSRELVWRAVGEGAFTKMNPSDEKVAKRVARILQTFPPI